MGDSAETRWFDLLEEDLESTDPDVRFEAVAAVGEIGDKDGAVLLLPCWKTTTRPSARARSGAGGHRRGRGHFAVDRALRVHRGSGPPRRSRQRYGAGAFWRGRRDRSVGRVNGGRRRLPIEDTVSAGGVVWRRAPHAVEVVLCGRNDGLRVLPKGTPDDGEALEQTALREVQEETGLRVRLGEPLGTIEYWFTSGGVRYHKQVHHWLMEPTGGMSETTTTSLTLWNGSLRRSDGPPDLRERAPRATPRAQKLGEPAR
jgi:8-oxo-dGTP pyrophosphatase MutT (NUDIX family)